MKFEDTHCRTCGEEYKQKTPKWVIACGVVAALSVGVVAGMPKTPTATPEKSAQIKLIEQTTQSRIALQAYLKDPVSAEVKNHKGNCGEVNSKNSFGGYTGFKRFIASPAIVVIDGENIESSEFEKTWIQLCK